MLPARRNARITNSEYTTFKEASREIATPNSVSESGMLLAKFFQSDKAGEAIARAQKRHQKRNEKRQQYIHALEKSLSTPGLSTSIDLDAITSTLKSPPKQKRVKTAGIGIKGKKHLSPIKNLADYHINSDIWHRTSIISGETPGERRYADGVQTPVDNVERADNMNTLQAKYMSESLGMQDVMNMLIETHNQIDEICKTMNVHRPQLSSQLEESNKFYLKLFERMLSEVLQMHRVKFKSQTDEMEQLKFELSGKQALIDEQCELKEGARAQCERLQEEIENIKKMMNARDIEADLLQQRLDAMEKYREDYENLLRENQTRIEDNEKERKALHSKAEADKENYIKEQLAELSRQWIRERQVLEDSISNQNGRIKGTGRGNWVPSSMRIGDKVEYLEREVDQTTSETQTQVDEYGVWDKQDGWVMPISGTAVARSRWRQGLHFAACPSCKGQGKFVGSVARLLKKLERGNLYGSHHDHDEESHHNGMVVSKIGKDGKFETIDVSTLSTKKIAKLKRQRLKAGLWQTPDQLVKFMGNLPRSIQASRQLSVPETLRRVWSLMEIKYDNDVDDDLLGYPIQSAEDFMIESHLERSYQRSEAEQMIWVLLDSIRQLYLKHPLLQTFSRFLGILDVAPPLIIPSQNSSGYSSRSAGSDDVKPNQDKIIRVGGKNKEDTKDGVSDEEDGAESRSNANAYTNTTNTDTATTSDTMEEITQSEAETSTSINASNTNTNTNTNISAINKKKPKKQNNSKEDSKDSKTHTVTNCKLNLDMFSIYLFARRCMLAAYQGSLCAFPKQIKRSKAAAGNTLVTQEDKLQAAIEPIPSSLKAQMTRKEKKKERDRLKAKAAAMTRNEDNGDNDDDDDVENNIVHEGDVKTTNSGKDDKWKSVNKNFGSLTVGVAAGLRLLNKKTKGASGKSSLSSAASSKAMEANRNKEGKQDDDSITSNPTTADVDEIDVCDDDDDDATLEELAEWPMKIPSHVCVSEDFRFYLPLDRVVQVFVGVLSFMKTDDLQAVLRELEVADTVFLTQHGRLTSTEGMNTMVRSAMRRFQKQYLRIDTEDDDNNGSSSSAIGNKNSSGSSSSSSSSNVDEEDTRHKDWVVLVNLDRALQLLIEVVRTRGAFVEESLKKLYIEGDENGDGVLSFQEFTHIVSKAAPHFHHRRILKMYREALNIDHTDAIHAQSFVHVCHEHGLVKLVDLEHIKSGPLRALVPRPHDNNPLFNASTNNSSNNGAIGAGGKPSLSAMGGGINSIASAAAALTTIKGKMRRMSSLGAPMPNNNNVNNGHSNSSVNTDRMEIEMTANRPMNMNAMMQMSQSTSSLFSNQASGMALHGQMQGQMVTSLSSLPPYDMPTTLPTQLSPLQVLQQRQQPPSQHQQQQQQLQQYTERSGNNGGVCDEDINSLDLHEFREQYQQNLQRAVNADNIHDNVNSSSSGSVVRQVPLQLSPGLSGALEGMLPNGSVGMFTNGNSGSNSGSINKEKPKQLSLGLSGVIAGMAASPDMAAILAQQTVSENPNSKNVSSGSNDSLHMSPARFSPMTGRRFESGSNLNVNTSRGLALSGDDTNLDVDMDALYSRSSQVQQHKLQQSDQRNEETSPIESVHEPVRRTLNSSPFTSHGLSPTTSLRKSLDRMQATEQGKEETERKNTVDSLVPRRFSLAKASVRTRSEGVLHTTDETEW